MEEQPIQETMQYACEPFQLSGMRMEVERVKRHCVVWANHIQHDFCDHMIEKYATEDRLIPAGTGSVEDNIDTSQRSCQRSPITLEEEREFIDYVYRTVQAVNGEFFNFDITHVGQWELLKYEGNPITGQTNFYKSHQDVLWHRNSDRKISVIIQLSDPDDYEGGDFITAGDISCIIPPEHRKKGSMIIFNSNMQHGIQPVTIGTRHSLVMWIHGPAWR